MRISPLRAGIAATAGGLILWGLVRYPLPAWPLAMLLAAYGAWLWRQSAAWLVVIPTVLPAYDLAPWSGWLVVGEADFFILLTIAVMAVRHPPRLADFWPGALAARLAAPLLGCLALGTIIGVLAQGPAGGSDNPYLTGWETARLAWPCLAAVILLGFARARHRTHGDTMVWFGFGMVAGLGVVSALALVQRLVFPGLLNLSQDYRVVGPFSSMHIGGGHIGAYIAFSLPFLNVCLVHRRRWSLVLLAGVAVLAAYALLVTFARTAYAAGMIGALAAAFGAPAVRLLRRQPPRTVGILASVIPLLVGAAVLLVGLDTGYMTSRFQAATSDLSSRVANWTSGTGLADQAVLSKLFGMGLGSYPRIAAARLPPDQGPSNYVREDTEFGTALALRMKLRLYFGQKLDLNPGEIYHFRLQARAAQPTSLGLILCQKMLLYSENCTGFNQNLQVAGAWTAIAHDITAPGQPEGGWSPTRFRPLELSFGVQTGQTVEVAAISLTDQHGHEHIANGDFANGLARWFFTDDHHWSWRIFNQYLMTYFELGVIGALAALLLGIGAFLGAARAMGDGDAMAACLAPALVAIAISFLFDAILEAPRLAALFYLMLGFGLEYLSAPAPGAVPAGSIKSPPP